MNLDEYPELLVPFVAMKLNSARTIWLSEKFSEQLTDRPQLGKDDFSNRFAYLIPGGVTFDDLDLRSDDSIVFQAERYGGFGIGDNGGGARCGTLAGMQIKGIGKNPLAGTDDIHHSYGGFKAVYAVHEAIYSQILSRILPHGAVSVHGVILTGPDAAFIKGMERGWGGLMVREAAMRPANFLRASHFSPSEEISRQIPSDVARVRAANKRLLRHCVNADGFITMLGRFLSNAASQFAFARLAGIMHGAVTPSNICVDGRWLDLTNTSFVSSSQNIGGGNRSSASFHEEMNEPVKIAQAVLETFSRFSGKALRIGPLLGYYKDSLKSSLITHLDYICGLPRRSFSSYASDDRLQRLLRLVLDIHNSAPLIYDRWPTQPPECDPLFEIMVSLFTGASSDSDQSKKYFRDASELRSLAASFFEIILSCSPGEAIVAPANHLSLCFIRSAKRIFLPSFFYKGRVESQVKQLLATASLDTLETYIISILEASEWVFDLEGQFDSVVTRTPSCVLSFNSISGAFEASLSNGEYLVFDHPRDALNWFRSSPPSHFILDEFDFAPFLGAIFENVLRIHERSFNDS